MRFMMIVKATADSEAERPPTEQELMEMGSFNEELSKAGILLGGEGLSASSHGARVTFAGGKSSVVDGPFSETKELIAGFWLIQARSREEAIEWARRVPFKNGEIEIRRVLESEDFAESDPTGELMAAEERLRQQVEAAQPRS